MQGPLRTILCADDIALVADSGKSCRIMYSCSKQPQQDNGMRLNVKEVRFISSKHCTSGSILDYLRNAIEKVEEYRCLANDLSEEKSVDRAMRGRINAIGESPQKSSAIVDALGNSKASPCSDACPPLHQ